MNENENRYRDNRNYNNNSRKQYRNADSDYKKSYQKDNETRKDNKLAFDARGDRRPDIKIADMNGRIYTIMGNFPSMLSAELVKDMETIDKLRNMKEGDINDYPELIDTLKKWALAFINLNIYGEKYEIKDVNVGFGDIKVLIGLFEFIAEEVNQYNKERTNDKR